MKYIILARNAYLSEDIEDFLKDLQGKANNAKVKKYIASNIRKYLVNDFPATQVKRPSSSSPSWLKEAISRGEEVFKVQLKAKDKQMFEHWVDYLNTLPESKDLSRISIPQLINHVKEWEESFSKAKANEEDGIEEIHKYSDGYKWVKVFGKKSLEREGKLMNHCVGSYYQQVKKDKTSIYSLRDKNNKPHITIEIRDKEIKQIKGNSNKPPKEEYRKYLLDFLNKKYVQFNKIRKYDLAKLGYVQINNKIYDIDKIPKGLTVNGGLDLRSTNITKLPDNLTVNGELDLSHTKITELPDNLTVDGDLDISGTNITKLPDNLTVNGGLDLRSTNITKLPDNLTVDGDLDISDTNITELPDNLTVNGDFDLSYTITKLPDNLTVNGKLDLSWSKITELPEDLTVNGDIRLYYSNITKLPDNLTVNGELDLSGTKITKLPDNLTVNDDLSLSGSKITELPETLIVKGDLYMFNCAIKEIPEGIKAKKIIISDDMKVINHSRCKVVIKR